MMTTYDIRGYNAAIGTSGIIMNAYAIRLTVALLAALSLLLGSGCATVQTTDAGAIGLDRKQYFEDGSRETMRSSAATAYDKILASASRAGALNSNAEQVDRVVTIANRLIPHVSHFRPEAVDWEWEVNVLSSSIPNATCMAGGKIFVFTGLLDSWQPTDDELAAVIGHEIGHALRDHSAEKYSTRKRNNSFATGLSAIVSVGLAATTGVNMSNTIGHAGRVGADAFANLPNSRELERESDLIGMELMARAGYDPRAAATLWQKVADQARAAGQAREGDFWSTHPSDASRIAELRATEPQVRPLFLAAVGPTPGDTATATAPADTMPVGNTTSTTTAATTAPATTGTTAPTAEAARDTREPRARPTSTAQRTHNTAEPATQPRSRPAPTPRGDLGLPTQRAR